MHNIGSLSIKHDAVGYATLILGPLFTLVWSLLSVTEVTWAVETVYVSWIVGSIYLFISLGGLGIHYFSRHDALKKDEDLAEKKSGIINDKAFLIACVICSLFLFSTNMTVYIKFFNVPPATNLTNTFYVNNITYYVTYGVPRIVVKTAEQAIAVFCSLIPLVIFFMPWSHAALLISLGKDDERKAGNFNARNGTALESWAASGTQSKNAGRV